MNTHLRRFKDNRHVISIFNSTSLEIDVLLEWYKSRGANFIEGFRVNLELENAAGQTLFDYQGVVDIPPATLSLLLLAQRVDYHDLAV